MRIGNPPQTPRYKRVVESDAGSAYVSCVMRESHPKSSRKLLVNAAALVGAILLSAASQSQIVAPSVAAPAAAWELPPTVTHVVVPQHRALPVRPGVPASITITQVDAQVIVRDRVASTTLEMSVTNPSSVQAEAVLLVPVPAGATVKGFSFSNPPASPQPIPMASASSGVRAPGASEGVAQIMPRDEARRLYDSIVRASRDPGLLEFAGSTLLRSSVFPIAAGATQRVRVEWEELVASIDGRLDYALPRSESLRQATPWTVQLSIKQSTPIAAVYSPSHGIVEVHRGADPTLKHFTLDTASQAAPGPFLLSILPTSSAGTASSIAAYPDPTVGGGYFMLLGGLSTGGARATLSREVTVVIDRSGSMTGGKLDQAKAAALQVIEGLSPGERFNIIDYSNGVSVFANEPVIQSPSTIAQARTYLASLRPSGGTNISDALVEALRQPHADGTLPIVLFLTDGLPTVGQTSERAIREGVERGNPHNRRIYSIGVGADVNVPLLDRIADLTRARGTYISPQENVEVKVAQVARQLMGPILTDIALGARTSQGTEDTRRLRDLAPRRIPDVFEGEQLVVFGAYTGESPTTLALTGKTPFGPLATTIAFDPAIATTRNGYVARLWATRRIAELVDEVRQLAADRPGQPIGTTPPMDDPRVKELVDEIVKLSARFGVLTEYTAFFANEGTNLGDWNSLAGGCSDLLSSRAERTRTGTGAVNQGINFNEMKGKAQVAYDNRFIDESMREQRILNVQQVNDRCFYNSAGRWVDSQLVASKAAQSGAQAQTVSIDETIEFGSDRHLELVAELAQEGRQGVLSLPGDTLVRHNNRNILVRNPQSPTL